MTATEVIERTNEKGILIAPTVGRQQSEYLGPMIHRELDLLSRMKRLPPMPDIIKRNKGEYNVVYTVPARPRARSRAQDVAGLQRTIQSVLEVVNARRTQDPSPLDVFNFDVSTRETAMIQAVPERWLNDDDTIAKKRQARAKQAEQQQAVLALPAQAAMIKAQATVQKAGGPAATTRGWTRWWTYATQDNLKEDNEMPPKLPPEDNLERLAAEKDAAVFGTGFLVDGVRVDPKSVIIFTFGQAPEGAKSYGRSPAEVTLP